MLSVILVIETNLMYGMRVNGINYVQKLMQQLLKPTD